MSGSYAVRSIRDARVQLDSAIKKRLKDSNIAKDVTAIRFPVCVCFLRGDRAGDGETLAEQLMKSFGFWNMDSGKYFDIVFPGWEGREYTKGDDYWVQFDLDNFYKCKEEFEQESKWEYKSETDIILLDYVFDWTRGNDGWGNFDFSRVICLPIEEMIRAGKVSSLDKFFGDLINIAKRFDYRSDETNILRISNKYAVTIGGSLIWGFLKEVYVLKDLVKIYTELKYYAVCDLRRN